MLESLGFRKYSTLVVFQLFYRRLCLCLCHCLCLCLCLCLCICISVWIWIADVESFQEMYGFRGPWGPAAVLQLTYELRPKVATTTRTRTTTTTTTTTIARLPLLGRTLGRGPTTIKDRTSLMLCMYRSNNQMNPSTRLLSRSCNMKCIAEKAGTTIWSMWEIWLMSQNFLFKFTA